MKIDDIEYKVAQGEMTAAQVFTKMKQHIASQEAIRNRLERLHTDSMELITIHDELALKHEEEDPEGSKYVIHVKHGCERSHSLIDKAVFEIRQLINRP